MPENAFPSELQALVTRPHGAAQSLAAALAARGIGALVEPLVEIHYRDDAALDLAGVQAVLCTSANGVRALARAGGERRLPLFAVGEATAARARAEGFATVIDAGGTVADLARLAAARLDPRHGRLMHAAGSEVAGDLTGELRRLGFEIAREILYEARPAAALSAATVMALHAHRVDFALFFSPRTGAIFTRLAAAAGVAECCGRITALSISAAADAAIGGLAWQMRCVARHPDQTALHDMLDRLVVENRRAGAASPTDREQRA